MIRAHLYPLYSKWAAEYARIDPSVRVNYQSLGSGAGIRQLSDGVVDFGATDEPMSDAPVVLLDAPDEGACPIAAVSFVVIPADAHGRANAEALTKFLGWAVHDGQSFAHDLDYVLRPPRPAVDR